MNRDVTLVNRFPLGDLSSVIWLILRSLEGFGGVFGLNYGDGVASGGQRHVFLVVGQSH